VNQKSIRTREIWLWVALEVISYALPLWVDLMEWWSNGVMKGRIQFEICLFGFCNTPILQYSDTPKELAIFTGKAIEL
jgi:hypothetical protein